MPGQRRAAERSRAADAAATARPATVLISSHAGTPVLEANADLPAGGNVTLVAHLDASGNPKITPFVNDVSSVPAGQARLVVRHTAAAPTVDVLAGGKPVIKGLSNGQEKALEVPAGSVSAAVAAAGTTDPVIGPADVDLQEGTATFVHAIGKLDGGKLSLVVVHRVQPAQLAVRRAVGCTVRGSGRRRRAGVAADEHGGRPGRRSGGRDPAALGRPALTGTVHSPSAPDQRGRSGALAGLVAGLALAVVPAGVWAAGAAVPAAHTPVAPPLRSRLRSPRTSGRRRGARGGGGARRRRRRPCGSGCPRSGSTRRSRPSASTTAAGWRCRSTWTRSAGTASAPAPAPPTGSAVLSGHVDDRDQGYGAFHRLGDLAPGDPVAVELGDGGVLAYRVETVTRVPKRDLPAGEVFARGGAPRLTLVTCGGPFDYGAHGYTENVVVVARPDEP